jgi:hypothetical protein
MIAHFYIVVASKAASPCGLHSLVLHSQSPKSNVNGDNDSGAISRPPVFAS